LLLAGVAEIFLDLLERPAELGAEVLQVIEPTDLAQERAYRLDGATLFWAAAGRGVAARRSFGQDPVQPIQVAADRDKVPELGEAISLDGHNLSPEANQQLGLASAFESSPCGSASSCIGCDCF
jgi:hypothetical protein